MSTDSGRDVIEEHTRRNKAIQPAHLSYGGEQQAPREQAAPDLVSLLSDVKLSSRANSAMRASTIQRAQQTHGNRAVQRYLQHSADANAEGPIAYDDDILARRIESASGSGQKLTADVRSRLEKAMGADLSDVQVHTGSEADTLARGMNALAFTSGRDIFFSAGSFDPHSADGLRLLAHETTHTVQQAAGPVAGTESWGGVSISDPQDSFEQAAEAAAQRVVEGKSAGTGHVNPVHTSSRTSAQRATAVQRFEIGFLPGSNYIHQTLTAESLKKAGLIGKGSTYESPESQDFARGTIWNDDPRMQLMKPDKFERDWGGNIDYGHDFMKFEDEAVRRQRAGEKGFGPGENMLARTHFGDMQFLHGMATKDKEKASETQDKMMKWAQFSTMIAQGKLSGDTKFSDLAKQKGMEDIAALFPDMKDQNINSLFGVKDGSKGDVIQQRAMGSLLHMVQDSYAGGHVERNDKGEVVSFNSYTGQDHAKHATSDALGKGDTPEDQLKNTPGATQAIDQGADVLKLVMGDKEKGTGPADWADIEKKLRGDVFKLENPDAIAGAGKGYEKHGKGLVDSVMDEGWEGFKEWGAEKKSEAWSSIKKTAINAAYDVKEFGKSAWETAGNAWDWVSDKAGSAWDTTKNVAGKAWEGAKGLAGDAWDAAKGAGSWVSKQAGNAWDAASGWASDTWKSAKGAASDAWDTAKKGANWVGNQASDIWGKAKSTASDVWGGAKNAATSAYNTASNAASSAWDWAGNAASSAGSAISGAASSAWDTTKGAASAVGNAASSAWDWMTSW